MRGIRTDRNRVRQYRRALEMTQEQLAHKAGVALRTIHAVEKGQDVRRGTMRRILMALKVPFKDRGLVFMTDPGGRKTPFFAQGPGPALAPPTRSRAIQRKPRRPTLEPAAGKSPREAELSGSSPPATLQKTRV